LLPVLLLSLFLPSYFPLARSSFLAHRTNKFLSWHCDHSPSIPYYSSRQPYAANLRIVHFPFSVDLVRTRVLSFLPNPYSHSPVINRSPEATSTRLSATSIYFLVFSCSIHTHLSLSFFLFFCFYKHIFFMFGGH